MEHPRPGELYRNIQLLPHYDENRLCCIILVNIEQILSNLS